ncbi:hypothetical protein acdb102_33270 [Acidothermaceae bacterium B102]|nr:hypothetical protein acdb102_33270 [Acidothermaceae bacterium B102]
MPVQRTATVPPVGDQVKTLPDGELVVGGGELVVGGVVVVGGGVVG